MTQSIKRRQFITLLGGAATVWPIAARAQQQDGRVRRIGVLMGTAEADPQSRPNMAAFAKALPELGWIDGRNIRIDYRWAASDANRMQILAKELVDLRPELIVAHTTPVVVAIQRETKNMPIVFVGVSDPVGSGFVESLPRPGGNMTGFINLEGSLGGKWLELLKEVMPSVKRAAFFYNPEMATYADYYLGPFEAAARSYAIEPVAAPVRSMADIERAVTSLAERPDGGFIVMPDTFLGAQGIFSQLVALAAHYRLPAVYPYRYMAAAGGLLSYGTDNADLLRRTPAYVDRILKGRSPSDLPVQLPTKFEFVLNLKTAKALGIAVPASVRVRVDEVIE